MGEKLKSLAADDRIFVSVMVVLVAAASFLLGRQSVGQVTMFRSSGGEVASVPVAMTYTGGAVSTATVAVKPVEDDVGGAGSGLYVASKSGSKYHHHDCSGAKSIKVENRVYFATESEARAAGYAPAANCKQLNQ